MCHSYDHLLCHISKASLYTIDHQKTVFTKPLSANSLSRLSLTKKGQGAMALPTVQELGGIQLNAALVQIKEGWFIIKLYFIFVFSDSQASASFLGKTIHIMQVNNGDIHRHA